MMGRGPERSVWEGKPIICGREQVGAGDGECTNLCYCCGEKYGTFDTCLREADEDFVEICGY